MPSYATMAHSVRISDFSKLLAHAQLSTLSVKTIHLRLGYTDVIKVENLTTQVRYDDRSAVRTETLLH